MVKYYPIVLHVIIALQAPNEIDSTSNKIHKHLENENLVFRLLIVVDILGPKMFFKHHYTVHGTQRTLNELLETNHEVPTIKGGQNQLEIAYSWP